MICQHTNFLISYFQVEAVVGAYKLIIFSVKNDQSSNVKCQICPPHTAKHFKVTQHFFYPGKSALLDDK